MFKQISRQFRNLKHITSNYFLCLKYPFLKIDYDYFSAHPKNTYEYTWLNCVPEGWRGLAMDMFYELKKTGIKFYFKQIKEKWGCYDEETEVLTKNGWKYFKDITFQDQIATLNPETDELEYHIPSNIIKYPYTGKMYYLNNRGVNLCVTPNHNLYVSKGSYFHHKKNNEKHMYDMELVTPDKYFGKDKRFKKGCKWVGIDPEETFKIPDYVDTQTVTPKNKKEYTRTYTYEGKEYPIIPFLRFLGFYVAEGHTNISNTQGGAKISIAYNPNGEEELVSNLIKNIGYDIKDGKRCKQINDITLGIWLKENCGHLASNKKVPEFIKNLSPKYIKEFLTYLFIGDGHQAKTSNILTTTSKQLCDDVCELLLKCGFTFSYNIREPRYNVNDKYHIIGKHLVYEINWLKNTEVEIDMSKARSTKSFKEEWIDYSGNVYCVTVPNHIIYVRRKGKGVWCGNCLTCYFSLYKHSDVDWHTIQNIIGKYSDMSTRVCIMCGKPAEYISKGWISPFCKEHIGDREYTKINHD